MDKTVTKKWKVALPTVILAAILIALVGLAFLPAVRSGSSSAVSAKAEIDGEAMGALSSCRAYAAANDYTTTMSGAIKARVFGIPYTQKINGRRDVGYDRYCEVAESVSAFVKAGVKKECADGKYCVYKGKYSSGTFKYGSATEYDENGYVGAYGKPFTDIVKYELEGTITSAVKTGDNTYKFVLDCKKATDYSRNEVKTTLGSKTYPRYDGVEFTLVTDGTRAVKVTSTEKFFVDMMGGADCTATYTETFVYGK